MKKALIICDLFPPAFGPRMGYLVKYMCRAGWEAVVLTEKIDDTTFSFLSGLCPVTYVDYYTLRHTPFARLQWLATFALDLLTCYKDRRIYREASRLIGRHAFGLIVCSSFRDFPLIAAGRAARKYHLPLLVDIRDVIEQYAGNEFITQPIPAGLEWILAPAFRRKSLARRNRALKEACHVTSVSPWHVELLKTYNPKVELIYNGYDPEVFFPQNIATERFLITYTGRLFSRAMRDPGLLFEAIDILSREGFISPLTFRVQWYVDEASEAIIAGGAAESGVTEYMDFKGYISAHEIPSALNHSSILLLLANKTSAKGPKGIMTTKVFESLAVEKPILCIRSDESYLEELLLASRSGLAAKECGEVCAFIRHHYSQWLEKGYTSVDVNRELTCSFSREKQAEQFMRIFDSPVD
ncbi:MAG: glycosyltransferase [Tannerellaceae bacterium]|jgi:glycosyltransferase involved in cell wall biosynthesis|nr:glycosyltransferase [Tannerellaceae bacterium]